MSRKKLSKIIIIALVIFFSNATCAFCKTKISVWLWRVSIEQISENGVYKEVQRKIPIEKIFLSPYDYPIYDFKNTPKKLYEVVPGLSCLEARCATSAYGNEQFLGSYFYYCPQDNGLYSENLEEIKNIGGSYSGGVHKYYRIADCFIHNGHFTVIFPHGTFASFRHKAFFSWGKDRDQLSIILPSRLKFERVDADYFKQ